MAITCPKCGAQFDATLFNFGHGLRCNCGAKIEYPGAESRGGHVARTDAEPGADFVRRACVQATEALRNADALLIRAGAGMGVDSGVPDFRGPEGF